MEPAYEELLEKKFLDLAVEMALKKWPDKKAFAQHFVAPVFGAKDARKTSRVLWTVGRNGKPRRLKLSEAIKISEVLQVRLYMLIADADIALHRDLQVATGA